MSGVVRPRAEVARLPRYSQASGGGATRWRASSNESAVPPSPAILEAISAAARRAHRYPTLLGDDLVTAVSGELGVPPGCVAVGGGSLALLEHALLAYAGPGTEIVYPWRSYEAYPILVGVAGAAGVPVPLDDGYFLDADAMAAAITPRTSAVLICNPNNPTGTELPHARIEELIAWLPPHVLVLLDEAYREFSTAPVDGLALLRRYPNVVLLRTFSKAYGLAGLRAGYLVAAEPIADDVRTVSPPFGLSAVAEAAAVAALRDRAHTARVVAAVTASRTRLRAALASRGLDTPPSAANFCWLPVGDRATALEQACLAEGVSVRAFHGEGVRVTVGDPEAEAAVLRAVSRTVPG